MNISRQAIERLPPNMNVEVTEAHKTVGSNFFYLLQIPWEAWALWSMVANLDSFGVFQEPLRSVESRKRARR